MNQRLRTPTLAAWLAIGLGWLLHVGKGVIVPIVFAVLVAYVIDGLARLLFRLPGIGPRVPRGVAYAAAALAIGWALALVVSLVIESLGSVAGLAPQYAASLLNLVQDMAARAGMETTPTWESLRREVLAQINAQRLIGTTVVSVTGIVSGLVVVLLYVAFILMEKRAFAAKLAGASDDPARTARLQRIIASINARIGAYLALKTLVSAAQGLVCYLILVGFGIDLAAFWAVLIGLLNFVPYLGSVLGVILPGAFATMQLGDSGTVLALLLSLAAAQFVIGFFVDPYLMANSLNLSPFVILASLAAWGSLWGIAGAFLAVPIMACAALVFAEFQATRPLAILLSRDGRV